MPDLRTEIETKILNRMPDDDQLGGPAAVIKILLNFPNGLTSAEVDALRPAHLGTLQPTCGRLVKMGALRAMEIPAGAAARGSGRGAGGRRLKYFIADLAKLPASWKDPYRAGDWRKPKRQPKRTVDVVCYPTEDEPVNDAAPAMLVEPTITGPAPVRIPTAPEPAAVRRAVVEPGVPRIILATEDRNYSFTIPQAKALYDQLKIVFG